MIGIKTNHTLGHIGREVALIKSPIGTPVPGMFVQGDGMPTLVGQIIPIVCGIGGASPRFMTRYSLYCPSHTQFSAVCLLN